VLFFLDQGAAALKAFNQLSEGGGGMQVPFYFVDVFAERPLMGNPLAIVPHAEELEEATMRQIAAELKPGKNNVYPAPEKRVGRLASSFFYICRP